MKIKSSIVVAAAAGTAWAPNALAADLPVKAPAKIVADPWNWTGFYLGGHLGAAWQSGRTTGAYVDDVGGRHGFDNRTGDAGFMGGGQIGYNWQHGMFVYGIEADISDLNGSGIAATTVNFGGIPVVMTSSNKIDWIGTVRGRLGATFFGNNLIYVTGGWAYGSVTNTHSEFVAAAGPTTATWQERTTRSGYAVGGGVEHMITPNWIVRLEGMYVDLGKKTLSSPNAGACVITCDPVEFSNKATMLRGAINYKF